MGSILLCSQKNDDEPINVTLKKLKKKRRKPLNSSIEGIIYTHTIFLYIDTIYIYQSVLGTFYFL
jgi:hypothetical protein